jgi:hypothetical protein
MNTQQLDFLGKIADLKNTIENVTNTYKNEIIPSISKFEKIYALNNIVLDISNDDVDEFCRQSCKIDLYERLNTKLFTYELRGGNSRLNLGIMKVIDSTAIKIRLHLNGMDDLILYFDKNYKDTIIFQDLDIKNSSSINFNYHHTNRYFGNTFTATIYTNYNFMIEIETENIKISCGMHHDEAIANCLINGFKYAHLDNKYMKIKYINTDTNESIAYNDSFDERDRTITKMSIDDAELNIFLSNCKKSYHPKIIFEYLLSLPLDKMKFFLNQIDGYTKFANETIIKDLQIQLEDSDKNYEIIQDDLRELNKELEQCETDNTNYIAEINKLKKENVVLTKKYQNLEKLYNSLLEA